jgi:branched-chain amino acid transport system substrate-binding protein
MRRRNMIAMAAVGALALAACGGDDDSSTTAPAVTTAPAPDDTEPDTTEPDGTDTTEPDTTDTTEPETTEPEPDGEAFAVSVDDCEDPSAATAVIEGDIVIGQSIPLSGGPAVLFAPWGAGFQAYLDYYNAEFGGVNGQQLSVVIKDDQYSADLTRAAVESLVFDDEVDLISGVIGSPNNAAIQDDLNAQCIPQLWAATGADTWGQVNTYPWTSGLLIPYDVEAEAWLSYAQSELGGGTIGLFYVNSEFGQAYAEAVKSRAGEYGFEIVAEETIDAADSGAPAGQMTNLVSADPDTILAVPLGAQCIAFMTELGNAKAANTDFDPLVYQTATCANPIFFGAVGNGGSDGVFTSANLKDVNNAEVRENDPAVQAYLEAFAASGSDADPGGIAVAGWVAAELTVYVIQQAADQGELTRETIINEVRNIDYVPSLYRDGLRAKMGPEDGFVAEGAQIQQWSVADGGFVDVGDVLDFEGFMGVSG